MTDRAAALTYFAMMALFPSLLVGVTLLGLLGQQSLVQDATNYLLEHGADPTTAEVVRKALQNIIAASHGALGAALVVSILLALNGASGAFGAAGRALNVAYGVKEDRGFVRRKLTDLAASLCAIVLFAVVLFAIFLGGQIADDLFGKIGLGGTRPRSGPTRGGRSRSPRPCSPTPWSTAWHRTPGCRRCVGSPRAP
jgi:membrane protein